MIEQDLTQLTAAQLRAEWRKAHRGQIMPQGLGRDLASRAITWRRQEKIKGRLAPTVRRELDRLAAELANTGNLKLKHGVQLKSGTRLVRQWHGAIYQVQVLEDGFEFENRHFQSLTQIARAITGTAWSGPRFFGLKKPDNGIA